MNTSRIYSAVVAAGFLALVAFAGLAVVGFGPIASPVSATRLGQDPGVVPSTCEVTSRASASPDIVLRGEAVTVTLHTAIQCPAVTPTVHIALILDGSAEMAGAPIRDQTDRMREFVQGLDLENNPGVQVGVVGHGDGTASNLCALSNSTARLRSCISRIGASGAPDLEGAIDEGLQLITRGRAGISSPDEVSEIMLVASGSTIGGNGCNDAKRAAGGVKAQGILFITTCAGRTCDQQCLNQLASSPRYYWDEIDVGLILAAMRPILNPTAGALVRFMALTETLAAGVTLVPGSASPAPNDVSPDGMTQTWRTAFVPREGVTFTFQAKPSRLGPQAVDTGAEGLLRDTADRERSFRLPAPRVLVLAPSVVPTATPDASSEPPATGTPGAGATSTPTPQPPSTQTPTARRYHIYLPYVLLNHEM